MRHRFNIFIPALGAMILIIAGIAWAQSVSKAPLDARELAKSCGSCHTMDKETESWAMSSHQSVACVACHANAGLMGWVHQKVSVIQMQFTSQGLKGEPVAISTTVPSERCIACHAQDMPFVMQDLDPPARFDAQGNPVKPDRTTVEHLAAVAGHDLHLTMKDPLSCTDCHTGVAHGPSMDNRVGQVELMHRLCLDCHGEQKVALEVTSSVACAACHSDLDRVEPEGHKRPDFRSTHGSAARSNIAACQQCHLNPGISGTASTEPHGLQTALLTVADRSRAATVAQPSPTTPDFPPGTLAPHEEIKDGCMACHGTTMPHPASWLQRHANGFEEKPELCASCHGTRDQGFTMVYQGDPRRLAVDNPQCAGCHGLPMPHPEGYKAAHPADVRTDPATCEACHSPKNQANPSAAHAAARFCLDCHIGTYRHAANWVSTHMNPVNSAGGNPAKAGCTECHTQTENSCTSCHTGGLGSTLWHPGDFTSTHGSIVTAAGGNQAVAACASCHTQTLNSCTDCHTGGVTGKTQWHPVDFVGTHGSVVNGAGGQAAAGCTDCHTSAPNSTVQTCTACHTGGLEKPTVWHPEMFWVSHARTTTPETMGACYQCHNYVEPSCSKCHTRY